MTVAYDAEQLDATGAWGRLNRTLDDDGHSHLEYNTIRHLRQLGAKSCVIEEPYIDRDYSSDYQQFYARTFRAYSRHCKRVHFFSADVSPLRLSPLSTEGLVRFRI